MVRSAPCRLMQAGMKCTQRDGSAGILYQYKCISNLNVLLHGKNVSFFGASAILNRCRMSGINAHIPQINVEKHTQYLIKKGCVNKFLYFLFFIINCF